MALDFHGKLRNVQSFMKSEQPVISTRLQHFLQFNV